MMELARIYAPIAADMVRVGEELSQLMAGVGEGAGAAPRGGMLGRIVSHPLVVPGKRLRPALVLLSSCAAGPNGAALPALSADPAGAEFVSLAVAVEILHAASLVHDDIIDGADSRRNQVSLNRLYGNRVAVLAGDILYTRFFDLVHSLPSTEPAMRLRLLAEFLKTTEAMCMGEIIAQQAPAGPLPYDVYLEIVTDKTAVLFAACCRTAAILRGAPPDVVTALDDYGLALGLTFQMIDDLMDGDYRLDPSVDLREKAREHADLARRRVQELGPSAYRDSLHALVGSVVGQAIP